MPAPDPDQFLPPCGPHEVLWAATLPGLGKTLSRISILDTPTLARQGGILILWFRYRVCVPLSLSLSVVVQTSEECEAAFDLCCQTLEELTANCPGYLGYLESQDTSIKPQSLLEYAKTQGWLK